MKNERWIVIAVALAALFLLVHFPHGLDFSTSAPTETATNPVGNEETLSDYIVFPPGAPGADGAGDRPGRMGAEGATASDPRSEGTPPREEAASLALEIESDAQAFGVLMVFDENGRKERGQRYEVKDGGTRALLELDGLTPGTKELVLYDDLFTVTRATVRLDGPQTRTRLSVPGRDSEFRILYGKLIDRDGWPLGDLEESLGEASIRFPVMSPLPAYEGSEPLDVSGWGAWSEGIVASDGSVVKIELRADGFVTVRGPTGIFGHFELAVPADTATPMDVHLRFGDVEEVHTMRGRLWPHFRESDDDPFVSEEDREVVVLQGATPAFPGYEPQDRQRYVYTLLDRVAQANSSQSVEESLARLQDWIEWHTRREELRDYQNELLRAAREMQALVQDLAAAPEHDPRKWTLDITDREEVVRKMVLVSRELLDFIATPPDKREIMTSQGRSPAESLRYCLEKRESARGN